MNIDPYRRNEFFRKTRLETFHRRKDKELEVLICRIFCIGNINTQNPVGN